MAIRCYSERKSSSVNQRLSSGERDTTGCGHVGHVGATSPTQTVRRVLEQSNEVWSLEFSAASRVFGGVIDKEETDQ